MSEQAEHPDPEWRATIQEAHKEFVASWATPAFEGPDTWEAAELALRELVDVDDDSAVSVLQVLQERGWKAPSELTVDAEAQRLLADIETATAKLVQRGVFGAHP